MYPAVAEDFRWPARLGGICAAVGAVGYVVMSGVALGFFLELTGSELEAYFPVFLPVMVIGSFVAFPVFSVICLRSGTFSRGLAVLLAIPPIVVVVNIVSSSEPFILIGIDGALAVMMVAIGYRLRAESSVSDRRRVAPPSEPAVG